MNSAEIMSRAPRKKHVQMTLDRARKPDGKHGGWRPNAGRKKKPGSVSHDTRELLAPRFPVHVTLRIVDGVGSLARDHLMKIIRAAVKGSQKSWFRIVEFNVLSNHLHLICEAQSKSHLARGIQGFEVRAARRLNPALRRTGKLFAQRYHVRQLKTPKEVRNALRYVLLNRKHHNSEQKFAKYWIDPYSSAAWFKGWAAPIMKNTDWKIELLAMERPTAEPTVWLLATGWRRHGLLRFDEAPA
jgi:REP element-mobilizing transposase RayT